MVKLLFSHRLSSAAAVVQAEGVIVTQAGEGATEVDEWAPVT